MSRAATALFAALLATAGAAAAAGPQASPAASSGVAFTARDQGNGEVLLEWPPQAGATGYRVERTANGIAPISLDAEHHTNVMDFSGIAATYQYRLLMRAADGTEREAARLAYDSPPAMLDRARAAAGRPPQLRSAIGTNLEGIAAWTTQLPFVDVMKSSGSWISGDRDGRWDDGRPLDVDADGWVRTLAPGQIARKLMLREIGGHYPGGRYRVRYKGEGTLKFQFSARVVSQKAGEIVLQVTPDNAGIYLGIEATNPANHLRDIEIVMPGGICEGDPFTHVAAGNACGGRRFLSFADYHRSILFYPVFAERLRAYSVLRFMDWMATNGSTTERWSQRTPLSFHTWATPGGVPLEVMLALANRVGAHPWFNMPHRSNDAYAEQFARVARGRLDAGLGIYIEYSNEVWNAMFPQYAHAASLGRAQRPAIDNMQYYALRTHAVGEIFKKVLGKQRTVSVLGGQAVNPWTATHGLDYLNARFGAAQSVIDAVAIAPYFSVMPDPAATSAYTGMTLDVFFGHVRTRILPQAIADVARYRAVAETRRLRLIGYEGGQHMVGILGAQNDDRLSLLFDAFNRDPRIKALYLDYLAGWKRSGGELLVHFNDTGKFSKWGRWGALEHVAQPRATAPKYDALRSFIEDNPVWWAQDAAVRRSAAR